MLLKEIADIRTGVVTSRKKNELGLNSFKYKQITLKSFHESGKFLSNFCDEIDLKEEIEKEFKTQKGDVLVRLREPNIAICIKNEEEILIPSLFAIVRLKKGMNIIPEYLAMILNSNYAKKQYEKDLAGSSIITLKISVLSEIVVPIIDIEKQRKKITLDELYQREVNLFERLIELKKLKYKAEINKIIAEDK
ncbi:MAG: hypothetical protein ACRCZ2_04835 [Fusobacteriaceae bacterium]